MSSSSPGDEKWHKALTATVRALCPATEVQVTFGENGGEEAGTSLTLPSQKDQAHLRGLADSFAFFHGFHDRARPDLDDLGELGKLAMRFRADYLGMRLFPGCVQNLQSVWSDRLDALAQDQPLGAALLRVLWFQGAFSDLLPSLLPEHIPFLEAMHARVGPDGAAVLGVIEDQGAFRDRFYDLLEKIGLVSRQEERSGKEDDDLETSTPEPSPSPSEPEGEKSEELLGSVTGVEQGESDDVHGGEEGEEGASSGEKTTQSPVSPASAPKVGCVGGYWVYTEQFDETIRAEDLCPREELLRLRAALDGHLTRLQGDMVRLARRLERRLLAQRRRWWSFDHEEGLLDAAQLGRVIVDPASPLSFKQEHDAPFRDTVVTLLLDNSGSMRGRPITIAALCADVLTRTLERCGIKVEVLGFTTRAWRGGHARELWTEQGKPPHPGRLNELRHILYKSADTPWRRARVNLGLMLREGILKENIDGEALLWAHGRLLARPEARRILMVISDGAPVDDSTLSVNGGLFLENHLKAVICDIERTGAVELLAIGICHDVTRYYSRAITLSDSEELGKAMVEKFSELF